eukprot:GFYU01018398.1.p1 GENE.GFYU01018398.1~~GFYU01018398.1.p1  ORF type:complete len:1165 (-),score=202.97 GFYU01018398.1:266-3760(-)
MASPASHALKFDELDRAEGGAFTPDGSALRLWSRRKMSFSVAPGAVTTVGSLGMTPIPDDSDHESLESLSLHSAHSNGAHLGPSVKGSDTEAEDLRRTRYPRMRRRVAVWRIKWKRLSSRLLQGLPAWLLWVCLLGVLVSGIIGSILFNDRENAERQDQALFRFQARAQTRGVILSNTVRQLSLNVKTLAGLWSMSNVTTFSRELFKRTVDPMIESSPSIRALEIIPRIRHSERPFYEAEARRTVNSDFQITARDADGELVVRGTEPEYFPVYYVHPFEGNEAAFGFDLNSSVARAKAMNSSRDTATTTASARLTLVQDGGSFGFLLFYPFYNSGDLVPKTVPERREQLGGFGLGVFNIDHVIRFILTQAPVEDGVYLRMFDIDADDATSLLYATATDPASASDLVASKALAARQDRNVQSTILNVGDRKWLFQTVATNLGEDDNVIMLIGIGLTFVLIVSLVASIGRTMVLDRLVQSSTSELRKSNASLALEVEKRTKAEESILMERDTADKLLATILPKAICKSLKDAPGAAPLIAQRHESVTVFFLDLAGFTSMSAKASATEVVSVLSSLFVLLDDLCQYHELEKIKTVGDCYMAAAGVPEAKVDDAVRAANFALDALNAMEMWQERYGASLIRGVRIGLHSGPLVAGVIGQSKFTYDLWGDTVNVASRMESTSELNKIQLSKETAVLLPEDLFALQQRGKINVKGKGEMTTYFLVGRSTEAGMPRSVLHRMRERRMETSRVLTIRIVERLVSLFNTATTPAAQWQVSGAQNHLVDLDDLDTSLSNLTVDALWTNLEEVDRITQGHALVTVGLFYFSHLHLSELLGITLDSFARLCVSGQTSCHLHGYSNSYRAADVTQASFRVLQSIGFQIGTTSALTPTGTSGTIHPSLQLALLVAGLCSTVDHPGASNEVLLETHHPLSRTYWDGKYVQHHTLAVTASLIKEMGLTQRLTIDDRDVFEMALKRLMMAPVHGAVINSTALPPLCIQPKPGDNKPSQDYQLSLEAQLDVVEAVFYVCQWPHLARPEDVYVKTEQSRLMEDQTQSTATPHSDREHTRGPTRIPGALMCNVTIDESQPGVGRDNGVGATVRVGDHVKEMSVHPLEVWSRLNTAATGALNSWMELVEQNARKVTPRNTGHSPRANQGSKIPNTKRSVLFKYLK